MSVGLAIAGIVQGLAQAGYSIYQDQRNYSSQQKWNKKYYELASDSLYNGVSIKASDMANAGLNPILASGANTSTASGSGGTSGESLQTGNNFGTLVEAEVQKEIADAQIASQDKIASQQNIVAMQRANTEALQAEVKRSEELYQEYVALSSNERANEKHSEELNVLKKQIEESNERIRQLQTQTKDLEYEYEWKKSTGTSNNSSAAGRAAADATKQVQNAIEGKPGVVDTAKNLVKKWWDTTYWSKWLSPKSKSTLDEAAKNNIQPPNPANYKTQKEYLDACAKVGLKNRDKMAVVWDDYQKNKN